MRRKRLPMTFLATMSLAAIFHHAGCAWLADRPEAPPEPIVAADRDRLLEAAASAFAGDAQEEWWVRSLDPVEGRFLLTRVERHRSGDEVIEVEVSILPRATGGGYEVSAFATRRTVPLVEGEDDGDDGESGPTESSGGYGRRFRDEEIEAKVLDRIRTSASAFRVDRPGP